MIKMTKVINLLQNKSKSLPTFITAYVGNKSKCYLTYTLVRVVFIGYLEIIAFQRLRMNIFTVKQLELYMNKYHPLA
jgi:hypothetical protein